MRKGWLKIAGFQDGERSLQEQMLGLDAALAECNGKTVLDLGCAEGTIGIEFARFGALKVVGYDYKREFIDVANYMASQNPLFDLTFHHADLCLNADYGQFDIVLALAILHKLPDPAAGVKLCCEASKDLIVVRLPIGSKGVIRAKHYRHMKCDLNKEFVRHGFILERTEQGPRTEIVQYWRKGL